MIRILIIPLLILASLCLQAQVYSLQDNNSEGLQPLDTFALSELTQQRLLELDETVYDFQQFWNYLVDTASNQDLILLLDHPSHLIRFKLFRYLPKRKGTLTSTEIVKRHLHDNPTASFIRNCFGNDGILDTYISYGLNRNDNYINLNIDSTILILLTDSNDLVSKYRCFAFIKNNPRYIQLAKQIAERDSIPPAIIPLAKYDFEPNKGLILRLLTKWLYEPAYTWSHHRYIHRPDLEILLQHIKMDDDVVALLTKYKTVSNDRNIIYLIDRILEQRADYPKIDKFRKAFYAIDGFQPDKAKAIWNSLKLISTEWNAKDPLFEDFYFDLWKDYGLTNRDIWRTLERNRRADIIKHYRRTLPDKIKNHEVGSSLDKLDGLEWYFEHDKSENIIEMILLLKNHSDTILQKGALYFAQTWTSRFWIFHPELIQLLLDDIQKNGDEKIRDYYFVFLAMRQDNMNELVMNWYKAYIAGVESESFRKQVEQTMRSYHLID